MLKRKLEEENMFGPDHLISIVLAGVAAAVSLLGLYDTDTKAWLTPNQPKTIVGYAVLGVCLAGILFVMNVHPFSSTT